MKYCALFIAGELNLDGLFVISDQFFKWFFFVCVCISFYLVVDCDFVFVDFMLCNKNTHKEKAEYVWLGIKSSKSPTQHTFHCPRFQPV